MEGLASLDACIDPLISLGFSLALLESNSCKWRIWIFAFQEQYRHKKVLVGQQECIGRPRLPFFFLSQGYLIELPPSVPCADPLYFARKRHGAFIDLTALMCGRRPRRRRRRVVQVTSRSPPFPNLIHDLNVSVRLPATGDRDDTEPTAQNLFPIGHWGRAAGRPLPSSQEPCCSL